jgi:hypothetical protein
MRTSSLIVGSALALALLGAACKESTSSSACGTGTPPSLAGTYTLVSATLAGVTFTSAQGASGTLRLHAGASVSSGTYGGEVTYPGAGVQTDSGSFSISGASCISQNSVMGQPQFSGTFTLANGVLTLSGTVAAQPAGFVWQALVP